MPDKTCVLVTGGQGFIGSNLVAELGKRGHYVWACDLTHSEAENYIRCDVVNGSPIIARGIYSPLSITTIGSGT